jgi:hypothetical protein
VPDIIDLFSPWQVFMRGQRHAPGNNRAFFAQASRIDFTLSPFPFAPRSARRKPGWFSSFTGNTVRGFVWPVGTHTEKKEKRHEKKKKPNIAFKRDTPCRGIVGVKVSSGSRALFQLHRWRAP